MQWRRNGGLMAKYIPKAHHGRRRVDAPIMFKKPLTSKVKTNTCNHCGGAINHGRGFDLGAGCFICGRAQSHVCPECATIPKGTVFENVNFEVDENETVR